MGGVAWSQEEDQLLRKCIEQYGEGKWHRIPLLAGINRCRKSCRLRWLNYLRPNIKRGKFTDEEVELIIKLHNLLGNRWSLIAGRLPGRTANDVKNYWHCHLSKKLNNSHVANSKPSATSKNKTDQEQMIGETLMSSTNNNDHGKRDSQATDNQDEHGSSNGIVVCVQGHSYEDCSNINVAQHKEIRFSCEENKLFEDLPTIDLDFDLEEIKITGGDPRKCSWDFDDLLFDMEI